MRRIHHFAGVRGLIMPHPSTFVYVASSWSAGDLLKFCLSSAKIGTAAPVNEANCASESASAHVRETEPGFIRRASSKDINEA